MRRKMVGTRLNLPLLDRVHGWAESRKLTTSTAIEQLIATGLFLERIKTRTNIEEWSDIEIEAAFLAFVNASNKKPELLQRWVAAVQPREKA